MILEPIPNPKLNPNPNPNPNLNTLYTFIDVITLYSVPNPNCRKFGNSALIQAPPSGRTHYALGFRNSLLDHN